MHPLNACQLYLSAIVIPGTWVHVLPYISSFVSLLTKIRKWDRQTMSALNLMAIVHATDIASIRDLKYKHIPLLENIRNKVLTEVPKQFSVDKNQLKMFVHCML